MGKLILIRHGETDKNVGNSLHTVNDSESLNKNGRGQIIKTAQRLKDFTPDKIYSSKEKRAVESAEIISKELRLQVETINGMEERNWGIFTGKPWEEVKKVLDPMSLKQRYEYLPPNGESWKTFENRLINAIDKIIKEHKNSTITVVTHGGAIRALMPFLLNTPKEESFKYDPGNASLTIFEFNDQGFQKVSINDTSHLFR